MCSAAKLKAAAKAANAPIACHAGAAQRGDQTDPNCFAKAHAKFAAAFANAETKGGCATTGDASVIDGLVAAEVALFASALRPVADANRCAALKLKATGKKVTTKIGCHATAVQKGGAVDPSCLSKAEARFINAFAKAEARPRCLTSSDAMAIEDSVDNLVLELVAALPAVTTTTTSTTPTSTTTTTVVLEPGDGCPCWSITSLAAIATNYFDAYGGVVCGTSPVSISSGNRCLVPQGGGNPPIQIPRTALGFLGTGYCAGWGDLDPDRDHVCPAPTLVLTTAQEQQACSQILAASHLYQSACP